ncbi:reverse transcriptase domain-containing protein, partial [Vibrio cholerae]|uniref:reverse transcriptase domain-containing protein n=1 Tax=Vibrio cholerae TaxID=666 RepID=UPI003C12C6C9
MLKPGKEPERPESYRPIALLSICYKLLERLIYNRILPVLNASIPVEQAGFRPGRNCCDQVLALTTYIEDGFEKRLKTSVAFIDLT